MPSSRKRSPTPLGQLPAGCRRAGSQHAGRAGRRAVARGCASARRAREVPVVDPGRPESPRPRRRGVREKAGMPPGVGPPTSAWWARLAAKPSSRSAGIENRRDQRDVGEVGAALEGVVDDPQVPGRCSRARIASTAAGIEPRCTGMCSACMTSSPRGIEERRRAVLTLLDVRRVGAADQHGAHLLTDRAQAADQDLQADRVKRHRRPPPRA